MIEFSVNKTKIQLDFSFFAVLAFCFFLDSNNILLMSFAACVIHEAGHLVVMLFYNINIRTLCFYGAGIKLSSCCEYADFKKRIAILLAGSTTNLIICMLSLCLNLYSFAAINLVTGFFNLLSVGDLDGRQIVSAVSEHYGLPATMHKTINFISLCTIIAVSMFFGDSIGITFYLTLLYMLLLK